MKTPGQNEKIKAFDRNAPLATPSASFSLRTFSNISSFDHRRILVDKTGLSFCFVSVISLVFFWKQFYFIWNLIQKTHYLQENIFLLFFFSYFFISSQLVGETNVSHFIERLKIFSINQTCLLDVMDDTVFTSTFCSDRASLVLHYHCTQLCN